VPLILDYDVITLTTRDPFGISRGSEQRFASIIVRVRDGDLEGLGEAALSRRRGSPAWVSARLERVRKAKLTGLADDPPALDRLLGQSMPARSAVDMALHDLHAKRRGVPLRELLGLGGQPLPVTCLTIGIDEPDVMRRKACASGDFPLLKVKVGFDGDVDVVRAIHEATGKRIVVDANGGWSFREACDKIDQLARAGVEWVEQPLRPWRWRKLAALRARTSLPLLVDEGVRRAEDLPRLRGRADGINVKLTKVGGIREALRMIETARALGLKVLLGCNVESSLACTAAAHLAPLVDWADLDGPLLIADDPFDGLTFEQGRIRLPDRPGLGVVRRTSVAGGSGPRG
jgi:L-alanine-DL-glutamate epimerase-like enolase superfamily enzyme